MKKVNTLLIICLIILITGCRANNKTAKDTTAQKDEITLELGNESYTFKGDLESCGSYQIQSNVVFSNEMDENGSFKGSYEFYECNENNVNLETATGTYQVEDTDVIFTDSYGQEINFEITSNDTVVPKNGSSEGQTFTK